MMDEKHKPGLVDRFNEWREKHISHRQFVLILSLLVGVISALAAYTLHHLIHFIQHLLTGGFDPHTFNWLYLVYPVIGIFITGLFIRKVVRDDISHGVTKVLYAISCRKGKIRRHNTWSSMIASGITIGFGGSVGAESPIVMTGSAIGSNLGSFFKMEKKVMLLLIGCGAAGAVSGIFKAPITGLVFVIEVLMIDLTMSSLLPLLISSVTAATLSYALMGTETMFKFTAEDFDLSRVPYVLLLGVVCGLVSLYFTKVTVGIEKFFKRFKSHYTRLLIGASTLSVLIFLFPPLYGEGYETIKQLIDGSSKTSEMILEKSLFSNHTDPNVTPLSMGIETPGGVMTKLIDANTTIPCKKSETFSTAADNQTEVTIHVLQGERPMANQNKSIGQFNLTGIAPAPRGVPQIEVTFDIDANGILKVSAKDKATGKEQAIRIEASSGLSKEEIERMKQEAEANADADKKEREKIDKLNQADSMVFQTKNQLNELGDKLPADKKAPIEAAVQKLEEAHKAQDLLLLFMFLVVVFKTFASTVTNCAGGCGGIFAPSLFLGCVTGYLFASLCNKVGVGVTVIEANFALFGMAALMSGVFHAPLTGVFLIAELTGGYDLFLPLMMVSVSSYLTVRIFDSNNIYAVRLAQRGELITHHKDQAVLTTLKVADVVEKDFMSVTPEMDLGALTSVVAKTKRNMFPVLNAAKRLVGIIYLDDIRHIMFRQELYHRYSVATLMREVPERLGIEEPMEVVMRKFEKTKAWNLPVEDITGEYIGFISKSAIFTAYRNTLLEFTSD